MAGLDAGERIPAALVILLFGLFLCLAPFDLAADYSFDVLPLATSWSDWRVIGTALLLALLAVAAIVWWRRRPLLALAVITFFCFTFVTSNIPLPIGTIFGERLLYTASLAVSFLIAALVGVLEPAGTRLGLRRALAGLLAFWLLASSVVILLRNGVWADNRTLYLHEADNQPRSVRIVLCAAGERLYDVQRLVDEPEKAKAALRQGLAMIEQVLTIDPEYGLAHANKMAVLTVRPPFLAEFVDVAAAEAACRLAINARHAEDFPDRSQAHFNLAGICRDSGRYTEAIEHYCESLILAPKAFDTFLLLCGLVADGRWTNDAFRRYLDEARQRQPRRAEWDGYQGILEARAGGLDAARRLLESALARIVPDKFGGHCGSEFRFALADVYIRQQQGTLVEPLLQCFLKQRLRPNLFERARRLVESARRRGG